MHEIGFTVSAGKLSCTNVASLILPQHILVFIREHQTPRQQREYVLHADLCQHTRGVPSRLLLPPFLHPLFTNFVLVGFWYPSTELCLCVRNNKFVSGIHYRPDQLRKSSSSSALERKCFYSGSSLPQMCLKRSWNQIS